MGLSNVILKLGFAFDATVNSVHQVRVAMHNSIFLTSVE